MLSDSTVSDIMTSANTIAVVGLDKRPGTASYDVASYQQSQGYKVIPVNPQKSDALGHKAVANVTDIQEPVDIVNVFVGNSGVHEITDQAIQKGAKAVWFQPGVEHPEAEKKARDAGLTVISHRCFKKEHQRLLSRAPF